MTRSAKASTVTGLIVVLLFVASWFLLISPKRSAAAELRDQAVAQDDANLRLKQKIAVLKTQKKDLPKQQARLVLLARHLPPSPELPNLVSTLDKAAASSGAVLLSLTPSPPAARQAAAAAPGAPVAPGSSVSPGGRPAAGGAGGPYLQEIAIQIKASGKLGELEQFLSELEALPRVILTTGVAIDSAGGRSIGADAPKAKPGADLEMILTSKVFLATPLPPANAAGAGGAGQPTPAVPAVPAAPTQP